MKTLNNDVDIINPETLASGFNLVDTTDIPTQLTNINYRLDIIITILLIVLITAVAVGVCYMIYRFLLRFI